MYRQTVNATMMASGAAKQQQQHHHEQPKARQALCRCDLLEDFKPLRRRGASDDRRNLPSQFLDGLTQLCLVWPRAPEGQRQPGIGLMIGREVRLLEPWHLWEMGTVDLLPLLGELLHRARVCLPAYSKQHHLVLLSGYGSYNVRRAARFGDSDHALLEQSVSLLRRIPPLFVGSARGTFRPSAIAPFVSTGDGCWQHRVLGSSLRTRFVPRKPSSMLLCGYWLPGSNLVPDGCFSVAATKAPRMHSQPAA